MPKIRLIILVLTIQCSTVNSDLVYIHTPEGKKLKSFHKDRKWAGIKTAEEINLHDFSNMKQLVSLDLESEAIKNLEPLARLNLDALYLQNSRVSDYSPVNRLTGLRYLTISHSRIADNDMMKLDQLQNVIVLKLEHTRIGSLLFLPNFPRLRGLYLTGTAIADLEPVTNCKKLTALYIRDTKIRDIAPLENMKDLKYLDIRNLDIPEKAILKLRSVNPLIKVIR